VFEKLQEIFVHKTNTERRFYGIAPQKLQNIRKVKSYSMSDEVYDMQNIFEELVLNELNIHKISAEKFVQDLIPLSQRKIENYLLNKPLKLDNKMLPAFRNYLLREYYPTMLERYSYEMLHFIKEDSESSLNFLNFFDGGEVEFNEKKYKKPTLKVESLALKNPLEVKEYYISLITKEEEIEEYLYNIFVQLNISDEWNTYFGLRGHFTRVFSFISKHDNLLDDQTHKELISQHEKYLNIEKEIKTVQESIRKVMGVKLTPVK